MIFRLIRSTVPSLCFLIPTVFCCCGSLAQSALPPSVSVQPVLSRQVTETGDFVGRVAALNKVDIVARVTGFIGKRNFTEGQMVKTGDLLFRIEPDTYKAAVDQQAANLAKAKATEVNANLQLQRAQALVKNQNVPQATVDELAATEQSAQADILQAQALLEQAKINLSYTEIFSPIDGRIGIANYTVGNLVSPSTGILATIVSQDPIYVTFQASEADVVEYRRRVAASADKDPHVVVHIRLPDGSIYSHPGLTNFLDVQVQADTDTVTGPRITAESRRRAHPGRRRRCHRRARQAPLCVAGAPGGGSTRSGRPLVLVVDDSKKVEQRRITTGPDHGKNIEVESGLKEGELVITDGIQKVQPGQVVAATVVPEN